MFIAVVLDSTSVLDFMPVLDSMPALDSMSVLDFMSVSFAGCASGLPVFPFLLSMSAGKAGTRGGGLQSALPLPVSVSSSREWTA